MSKKDDATVMRGIAKLFFFSNEAFLVVKSALAPHGANPTHIHMTQEKLANFSKQGFSTKCEFDWA